MIYINVSYMRADFMMIAYIELYCMVQTVLALVRQLTLVDVDTRGRFGPQGRPARQQECRTRLLTAMATASLMGVEPSRVQHVTSI